MCSNSVVSAVPEFELDVDERDKYRQRCRIFSSHEQRYTLTGREAALKDSS